MLHSNKWQLVLKDNRDNKVTTDLVVSVAQ